MGERRPDPASAQTVFFTSHPAWLPPVATAAELPVDSDDLMEGMRCYVDAEDRSYRFDGISWQPPADGDDVRPPGAS